MALSKIQKVDTYEDSEREKIQLRRKEYLLEKLNKPKFEDNSKKKTSQPLLGKRSMSLSSIKTDGRNSLVLM